MTTMNVTFKLRRDTTANWATYNPVLQAGEIGIDTTLNKFKIGNGSAAWGVLNYANLLASDLTSAITAHNNDTTDVHGIADTSVLATNSSVSSAISTHNSVTTNVHGIANTALLATQTFATSAAANALTSANTYTDTAISNLVGAAPALLNTLSELSDALNDNPNFAAEVASQIASLTATVNSFNARITSLELGLGI
jgi:Major tropism determinant N-terminal domain